MRTRSVTNTDGLNRNPLTWWPQARRRINDLSPSRNRLVIHHRWLMKRILSLTTGFRGPFGSRDIEATTSCTPGAE